MAIKRSQIAKVRRKNQICSMVLAGVGLETRAASKVSVQKHLATRGGPEFFSWSPLASSVLVPFMESSGCTFRICLEFLVGNKEPVLCRKVND